MHDDSDRRFWVETGTDARIERLIAAVKGSTVCVGVLDVRAPSGPGTGQTIKSIAESIGGAPEKWLPESNP